MMKTMALLVSLASLGTSATAQPASGVKAGMKIPVHSVAGSDIQQIQARLPDGSWSDNMLDTPLDLTPESDLTVPADGPCLQNLLLTGNQSNAEQDLDLCVEGKYLAAVGLELKWSDSESGSD